MKACISTYSKDFYQPGVCHISDIESIELDLFTDNPDLLLQLTHEATNKFQVLYPEISPIAGFAGNMYYIVLGEIGKIPHEVQQCYVAIFEDEINGNNLVYLDDMSDIDEEL